MDFLNYAQTLFRSFPPSAWTITASDNSKLKVTDRKAGLDLARGPWISFRFNDDGVTHRIIAYMSLNGRRRIQIDGHEVDQDKVAFKVIPSADKVQIVVHFRYAIEGQVKWYRFVGEMSLRNAPELADVI